MKKRLSRPVFVLSLAIAVGVFSAPCLFAQDDLEEVKLALERIGAEMSKAAVAGDYESQLKHYTDDLIIMADFQPMINSKARLKELFKKEREIGLKYHSITGTIEDLWMCGDLVYDRGTFGMAVSRKADSKPRAYHGSYFQIWEKQKDGSFKIKMTIWNLDFNPFGGTD